MLSVWRHSDAICAYNWNLWEIYSPRRGRRLYCHMSQKWPKYLYWFKGVKIIWIDWWECCLSGSEAIPVYSICCNVQYREEQMGDPNPFFDLFYLHRPFKRQCYKIKGRLLIYLGMHNAYFWLNLKIRSAKIGRHIRLKRIGTTKKTMRKMTGTRGPKKKTKWTSLSLKWTALPQASLEIKFFRLNREGTTHLLTEIQSKWLLKEESRKSRTPWEYQTIWRAPFF